jgi:CPA1 family monovalent cation:H+ antiporter
VFLITGLQARTLIANLRGDSLRELAASAAVVCGVVIVTRFVWMYPATYLPRWLIPSVARDDPAPPWQWPFALAFTGVRGIVSLAAALAIPLTTESGALFPDRERILFLTFSVIIVTLVGQGLMLPAVIRGLGLAHAGRRERNADTIEEAEARRQALEAADRRLDQLEDERQLSQIIVRPLRIHLRERHEYGELRHAVAHEDGSSIDLRDEIELLLLAAERQHINNLYVHGQLKDEARRRIERELDLREAQFTHSQPE